MRSIKLYSLSFLICSAIIYTGCSGFLDEEPISEVADEKYWNTQDEGNSAIAGCYAQLRRALTNVTAYYAYGDLPTDVFTPERDLGTNHNYAQELNWGIAVASTETSEVMYQLRNFGYFYSTIRQANLCIAKIPTIPTDGYDDYETMYNQFMGEAYFIRAFAYFYMTRVWGDVPIVDDDQVDEVDLTNYSRDSRDKVLAKAISDCETALGYLSWDYTNTDDRVVRANAGAAWALLAHLYAWQGDYENCEIATAKVINQGYYSYIDRSNYLDIFEGQSDESIFEIAKNSNTEADLASGAGDIASYLLRDDYLNTRTETTLWPFDTLTLRQTLFHDENDLRRTEGFWQFDDDYPVLLKYTNIQYTNDAYAIGMNNIVIFRLAGIALLQAEAQAARGKFTEARITLDDIRARAGLEESEAGDDELFEAIIEERGRELFMEGHRFYDLVRLARAQNVYRFGSDDSNKIRESEFWEEKYYWPIQPSIIETNPLLIQTTFWQSEME